MPSKCRNRAKTTIPVLPNEILGLLIESLGDDFHSLRACSLVSSVFRHFCGPVLYRDVVLDHKETVDTFLKLGERSESLQYVKSLILAYYGFETKPHLRKPRKILEIISRKASLQTLRLHRVQFHVEPLTAPLLSKLCPTVTVLVLQDCRFGGFEDFVSLIRCFPNCETLCLRCCTWFRQFPKLKFRNLPICDRVAPVRLEIMSSSVVPEWGEGFCDQGRIVGTSWLDLGGLKSFAYVIEEDTASEVVLRQIASCEFLEEVDMTVTYPGGHSFGEWKPSLY